MATLDPRELDMFLNQARVKLPGASTSGLKLELFDVVKEFLADTNCWWEDIEFQATKDVTDYILMPTDDGQIIRLEGVFDQNWGGLPAVMPEFGILKLIYAPSSTPSGKYKARVYKNVQLPTSQDDIPLVPDWLLRVYGVHILDGLLGKMMTQQTKSYTNTTTGTYHLRRFKAGIATARAAARRQNLLGGQEWAFPRGWGTRTQRGSVSTSLQRF